MEWKILNFEIYLRLTLDQTIADVLMKKMPSKKVEFDGDLGANPHSVALGNAITHGGRFPL